MKERKVCSHYSDTESLTLDRVEALCSAFSILFTNAFWLVRSIQHNVNRNRVPFIEYAAYYGELYNQNYRKLIFLDISTKITFYIFLLWNAFGGGGNWDITSF